jgi:hypothetical protein
VKKALGWRICRHVFTELPPQCGLVHTCSDRPRGAHTCSDRPRGHTCSDWPRGAACQAPCNSLWRLWKREESDVCFRFYSTTQQHPLTVCRPCSEPRLRRRSSPATATSLMSQAHEDQQDSIARIISWLLDPKSSALQGRMPFPLLLHNTL